MREEDHVRHDRSRLFRRLLALPALAVGSAVVLSCTGDTLYDVTSPTSGEGPTVAIVSPDEGGEILVGQRVALRVEATDPDGVESLVIGLSGAVSRTFTFDFRPPRTLVQVDTAFTVPTSASGTVRVSASAVDSRGYEGSEASLTVRVSDEDRVAPRVAVQVETTPRMERTDRIRVTVASVDNPGGSGVVENGVTAIIGSRSRADTVVLSDSETFNATGDTVVSVFELPLSFVDREDLPDSLDVSVFGLTWDAQGNCSAAVSTSFSSLACEETIVGGSAATVGGAPAPAVEVVAVTGRTSLFPGGGTGADLVVDTARDRAYVSNISRNRVETLDAASGAWTYEAFVGAQPWGLSISPDGDSLAVANSGGTSISHLSLAGRPAEDLSRRLVTHNTPLFEISREVDEVTGFVKLSGVFIDFSDRPQFIAQDAEGRLLYSTRPTEAAGAGTIRVVDKEPGWAAAEAKILLLNEDIRFDTSVVALAHVDSVSLFSVTGGDDLIEIYDHRPGFPNVLVRSGVKTLDAAVQAMVSNPNSDMLWGNGTWRRERLSFQDTTFVAASGDREWVAFGANVGPITLWDASAERIHSRLLVADLVNNASERVTGIDLNEDGSLGAAQGRFGSYYWNTSLRLLGSVGSPLTDDVGGAGVALHPRHPSFQGVVASADTTISFVGAGDHTIRILDTVHFTERGRLYIRDNVTGPLRAGPPLPSDNGGAGASCTGQDCVVVKLYALTDAGGVVVVDVRRRDIGGLQ